MSPGAPGPEGLITILEALDQVLPAGVKLHLFGVKGEILGHLDRFLHRIGSMDSMAWDFRARQAAQDARAELRELKGLTTAEARKAIPNNVAHRADHMAAWHDRQVERARQAVARRRATT